MSLRSCILGFLALTTLGGPAVAQVHQFTEDFSTRAFCDTLNTTARWDTLTGLIGLPEIEIQSLGQVATSDEALGVAIDGDLLCIAADQAGLLIYDGTDLATPVPLASYNSPGETWEVVIDGTNAFIADGSAGLAAVDISDPGSPALLDSLDTPGNARALAVIGNLAYVADDNALLAVDVTDRTDLTLLGTVALPGLTHDLCVAGNVTYVACGDSGLVIVDVTDPTAPGILGRYSASAAVRGLDIAGDFAYLACGSAGLEIVRVSDPALPVFWGGVGTTDAMDAIACGTHVYVADGIGGLQLVEIADPHDPLLSRQLATDGSARRLVLHGTVCLIADQTGGVLTAIAADLLEEAIPVTDNRDISADPDLIRIHGDYAFVRGSYYGSQRHMYVFDISDPTDLQILHVGMDILYDFELAGDWLIAAGIVQGIYGLHVYDITDPAAPVHAASYDAGTVGIALDISGNYAYWLGYPGMTVFDIRDPYNPLPVGSYSFGSSYLDQIEVVGKRAYITQQQNLSILDVSDPTSPTHLGTVQTYCKNLAVCGNYVFNGSSSLKVVDVSDPTIPTVVRTINYDDYLGEGDIDIYGDRLYVTESKWWDNYGGGWTGVNRIVVFDITDPTDPQALYTYPSETDSWMAEIAIVGDLVFTSEQLYYFNSSIQSGVDRLACRRLLARDFQLNADTGRSLPIHTGSDEIVSAHIAPTQIDSVHWSLSADNGLSWDEVTPGAWHALAVPGDTLLWETQHAYQGHLIDPNCSEVTIDWLYRFAILDGIVDIPGDQGGRVRVHFTRSGLDFADPATEPIASYAVWRRIEDLDQQRVLRIVDRIDADLAPLSIPGLSWLAFEDRCVAFSQRGQLPPGIWEVLGSFPAVQQPRYTYVAETLGDSSGTGIPYTTFCVTAHTTTPSIWYASRPDSGYSIDNLPPAIPTGLDYSPTMLTWDSAPEPDFAFHSVYGSESPDFATAELIGHSIDPEYGIGGLSYNFFFVTTSDHAGNESGAATVGSGSAALELAEQLLVLHPAHPNPGRTRTSIAFNLPAPGLARLKVIDATGRTVAVLHDGPLAAGSHRAHWAGLNDAGERIEAGCYFLRLEVGGRQLNRTLIWLR